MVRWLVGGLVVTTLAGCQCGPPGQCSAEGREGTVALESTGLPAGLAPAVRFTGPGDETRSGLASSLPPGEWTVHPPTVTTASGLVREVWRGTPSPATFCLAPGGSQTVSIAWARVPTSDTLWAGNRNASAQLVGFRDERLAASATVAADVAARGPIGGGLTFDKEGNVWALGPTVSDATIVRYPAERFGASGTVAPDTQVDFGFGCIPEGRGLAFDSLGQLYVSSPCQDGVIILSEQALAAGPRRALQASVKLDLTDPAGLAFDPNGNLWVASSDTRRIHRFDGRNGSVPVAAWELALGVYASTTPGDTSLYTPSWIAFDANGDLWANDFAANTFYRVPAAQLAGTGTREVQPAVRVTVGVLAVLEGFAFDEAGGLWSAGAQGRLIRLSPAQLTVSSSSGSPTMPEVILASGDLGSAGNVAFYPAPAWSPLFHRLP